MESGEVQKWLRERYQSAPTEGPLAKKMKFGDLQDALTTQFSSTIFNPRMVSREIKTAFPNTFSKASGKGRLMHIYGIEQVGHELPCVPKTPEHEACEEKIKLLEKRVQELEKELNRPSTVYNEMNSLLTPSLSAYHGPNDIKNFDAFSMDSMVEELTKCAPNLFGLFQTLGQTSRHIDSSDSSENNDVMSVMSLCTLLKCRSQKVLGVQLLITLMLLARSTNKQAIAVLNHAGVCVSYSCAWQYLNKLATQARYLEVVRTGHWQWVFDNVNMHQKVRHEREECHSSMLNITARLAVRLRHLPDWDVDWSDTSPQKSRQSLTISDILPDEDDAAQLHLQATHYMMNFLVKEFKDLAGLKKYVPPRDLLHPVKKSEVVPMKVLFKDEKYTSETIDILSQFMNDASLNGDSQVHTLSLTARTDYIADCQQIVVGDQMTCKNIRGSKLWRQTEINAMDRLGWVNEVPGDFHFLWECLRVLFAMFWGTPSQPGSLCNLREVIRRTQVDKSAKVFNIADEFVMHVFRAHLLTNVMSQLNINQVSDTIDHQQTKEWLHCQAEKLVNEILMPQCIDDSVHQLHKSFLHHAFLYVNLREAIRWEDGPQIVRHWKWWIPRFIGTGKKNYATEAVNMVANLTADFPKHIAYLAIHNRTVNIEGKPGHGKPVDQLMEHYNLVFKQALQSGGGRLKVKHIEDVSLAVLFLMEAAKKTDKAFRVKPSSTTHTVRDTDEDVMKIVKHLEEKKVQVMDDKRSSPAFTDPTESGWKKISTTTWLKDTLSRSLEVEAETSETVHNLRTEQELDLYYELTD